MGKNITIGALVLIIAGLFTYIVVTDSKKLADMDKTLIAESTINSPILFTTSSPDSTYQALTYLSNANKQKSYKLDPDYDMISKGTYGDTVAIRNLKTGELIPVWQDKNDEFVKVNNMLFSADGTKLFFTTDAVFMYDMLTKQTKQLTPSYGFGTPQISKDRISPNASSMIVVATMYEASKIDVVSIPDGKIIWDAGVIEAGGGDYRSLEGYIRPGYILVTEGSTEPNETKFFAYTTTGKLVKEISTVAPSVYIENLAPEYYPNADKNILYVQLDGGGIFEINKQTFERMN